MFTWWTDRVAARRESLARADAGRSIVGIHGGRVEARSAGPTPEASSSSTCRSCSTAGQGRPIRGAGAVPRDDSRRRRNADGARRSRTFPPARCERLGGEQHPGRWRSDTFNPGTGFRRARCWRWTDTRWRADPGDSDRDGARHRADRGVDQRRPCAAAFDHHLVKPPDIERLCDLLMANCPRDHSPAGAAF